MLLTIVIGLVFYVTRVYLLRDGRMVFDIRMFGAFRGDFISESEVSDVLNVFRIVGIIMLVFAIATLIISIVNMFKENKGITIAYYVLLGIMTLIVILQYILSNAVISGSNDYFVTNYGSSINIKIGLSPIFLLLGFLTQLVPTQKVSKAKDLEEEYEIEEEEYDTSLFEL